MNGLVSAPLPVGDPEMLHDSVVKMPLFASITLPVGFGRREGSRCFSLLLPQGEGPIRHKTRTELPRHFLHLPPEGWLREAAATMKIDVSSPEAALVHLCRDTIGAGGILAPGESYAPDIDDMAIDVANRDVATCRHANCLYCHRLLPRSGADGNYHPACSRTLFGADDPPVLCLNGSELLPVAQRQLRVRHSLTGVQPKFSGKVKEHRSTVMLSGCYIVKPEPNDGYFKDMAVIEVATMHFALALGLPTAPCGLRYLEGEARQ